MQIKILFNVMLLVLSSLIFCKDICAWENRVTHPALSSIAADNSVLSENKDNYLSGIGYSACLKEAFKWNDITKTAKQWLQEGAELEDGKLRELNHFHNPLKPWSQAGLHILGVVPFGESTVLWSQDSSAQANWSSSNGVDLPYPGLVTVPDYTTLTDWSWLTTRNYFYSALIAGTKADRESNFAAMFFGLGHQMHLLQDMSVPMHVRNNQHLISPMIEGWVKDHDNFSLISLSAITVPSVSLVNTINGKAPIARLFDTGRYLASNGASAIDMSETSYGLAEWTNANFFSDDTINLPGSGLSTQFPYPNLNDTDFQTRV